MCCLDVDGYACHTGAAVGCAFNGVNRSAIQGWSCKWVGCGNGSTVVLPNISCGAAGGEGSGLTRVDGEVAVDGYGRGCGDSQVEGVNAWAVVGVSITIGVVTAEGVVATIPGVAVALADGLGIVSSVVDGKVERHDAVAAVSGCESVTICAAFGVGSASEGVGFASSLCHIVLYGRAVDGKCHTRLVVGHIHIDPIVCGICLFYSQAEVKHIVVVIAERPHFIPRKDVDVVNQCATSEEVHRRVREVAQFKRVDRDVNFCGVNVRSFTEVAKNVGSG